MKGEGRRELKYIISEAQRPRVLEIAAPFVQSDAHADDLTPWLGDRFDLADGGPPRGYRVNTLYLDTAHLKTYTQRLRKAPIRDVVRIRTYGNPDATGAPVFLEDKRKLRDRVVKHRSKVGKAGDWNAQQTSRPWLSAISEMLADPTSNTRNRRLAERWLRHVEGDALRTVLTVHYVREVFVEGTSRLTIDHLVHAYGGQDPCDLQGDWGTRLIREGFLVLELKFNGRKPVWMRKICSDLHLLEEPVSKYGLGVAYAVRDATQGERAALTPPTILRHGRAA